MRVYPYLCQKCKTKWEAEQDLNHQPPTSCPACGERDEIRRLFPRVSVIYKTYGYYRSQFSETPPAIDSER